jgi:Na+-transporting methylmalonyl-CoA/oxaloacetate decarboxylase gamma subunit
MDFSLSNIHWDNLFANGQNFISFSMMGMAIVFVGLTIISIYIVLLPKILNLPQTLAERKESEQEESSPAGKNDEVMLAIAVALHLDQTNIGGLEKITWERGADLESAWLTAGRMRSLAVRSHLPDHRT